MEPPGKPLFAGPRPKEGKMAVAIAPEKTRECLDACTDCIEACEACARHCIEAADSELIECTRLCLDCSALCTACIPLLARDSRFYAGLCGLCAEACDAWPRSASASTTT